MDTAPPKRAPITEAYTSSIDHAQAAWPLFKPTEPLETPTHLFEKPYSAAFPCTTAEEPLAFHTELASLPKASLFATLLPPFCLAGLLALPQLCAQTRHRLQSDCGVGLLCGKLLSCVAGCCSFLSGWKWRSALHLVPIAFYRVLYHPEQVQENVVVTHWAHVLSMAVLCLLRGVPFSSSPTRAWDLQPAVSTLCLLGGRDVSAVCSGSKRSSWNANGCILRVSKRYPDLFFALL